MRDNISVFLTHSLYLGEATASIAARIVVLLLMLALAFFIGFLCKKIITPIARKLRERTTSQVDDYLLNDKMLGSLSYTLPSLAIYTMLPLVVGDSPKLLDYLMRASFIYIIIMCTRICCILVGSFFTLQRDNNSHENASLQGVQQMIQIIIIAVGVIWCVGTAINRNPITLIAGLGAIATILSLIFKDSLVGLVAGIQLTLNDMVRIGDWITVPGTGVDGTVQEITLTTVKVLNFDNTVVTVPPYTLVSGSFQNWRNVFSTDARRICRSINIDISSIQLCTQQEAAAAKREGSDRPTNLDLYMEAMEQFLKKHPAIHSTHSCMVRQLQPTAQGMPVQFYCFSKISEWIPYEHLQTQIINHVTAMLPAYRLRVYQAPTTQSLEAAVQPPTENETTFN